MRKHQCVLACFLVIYCCLTSFAEQKKYCGKTGVWIQILGSGGPEIDDGNASTSYLVWLDGKARLLVDTGPGSSVLFDQAGAQIEDLDAIVFTHLHADHSSDFPAYIHGASFEKRDRSLRIFGPDGNDYAPSTNTFIDRMIGPQGAYPHLKKFLTFGNDGGYKVTPQSIPATGRHRWAGFGSDNLRLSAIPVHHGSFPALAWRVDIANQSIVFTGDFNNNKDLIAKFAKNTDALVTHLAIPETARGTSRTLHALPSQIGRIAHRANARMVILGHRMNITRGRENQSREAVEKSFSGPLLFANDLECWGL
ncbi:MAG: MBL fold metallo-hydrolase [Pseudomonadales bacterium]|nr:MBL fold metallo-hydrolase [Pseudomonadales bacterium]